MEIYKKKKFVVGGGQINNHLKSNIEIVYKANFMFLKEL